MSELKFKKQYPYFYKIYKSMENTIKSRVKIMGYSVINDKLIIKFLPKNSNVWDYYKFPYINDNSITDFLSYVYHKNIEG